MSNVPIFFCRVIHVGQSSTMRERDHPVFRDRVYWMTTNLPNLPSLCYDKDIIRLNKFDEA